MSNLDLVDIKEMARILNVPVSWIYQRTRLGQEAIPFIKLGKYIRFNPQEVMQHFGMLQKIDSSDLPAQEKERQKKIEALKNRPIDYDVAEWLSVGIKKYGSIAKTIAAFEDEYFRKNPITPQQ